ncbi:hypothetical protein BDW74DRAFT_167386 [Aspergillus multicolor]|uniref:uncharacterized protein n=1 Tax=Aspergillus multicolor TaxID=41759 RepID=UPI003CCCCABD
MESPQTDPPSVQDLHSGAPFVPFSEFSVQALQAQSNEDASRWIENKLRDGRPFVVRGFAQTDAWRTANLSNESLVNLSASAAIPVRNCQTGRYVKLRLRDLLFHSDQASAGDTRESLYAKDLHCPKEWVKFLETILPSSLRHLGSLDLFRVLPKETAPEVLLAYVGTRMSFSGFHRCFSATVVLNLIIESEGIGPESICFGADTNSQEKYDAFIDGLGKSAHTDWANVSISKLRSADFPIYVTDQGPGDLVVFPAVTAHQVWNISSMVTKVVWNIMHSTSVASFFDYVQPAYHKQCHADTSRVPLVPMYALQTGVCGREEELLLLDIFHQQVSGETVGSEAYTVDTQGAVVECNFCGLTIWNRHLHCEECRDFDLCLTCFVWGRSCKHVADYTWAEILPLERCRKIIMAARNRLGVEAAQTSRPSKSLGAVAAVAMGARQQLAERLCHLCRDSHPSWKGTICNQCSAFFCFRGLHRHFGAELISLLGDGENWTCPKCEQICNCRCCHFNRPYQSKDKPVRGRIKSIDTRGRQVGFADDVLVASSIPSQTHLSPRGDTGQQGQNAKPTALIGAELRQAAALDISGAPSTSMATPSDNNLNHTSNRTSDPLAPFCRENQVETASDGRPAPLITTSDESVLIAHPVRDRTRGDTSDEESTQELENKIKALRGYADDVLELSLMESHARILDRISQFEAERAQRKRRKTELLLSRLDRDFPDLAALAREEARR